MTWYAVRMYAPSSLSRAVRSFTSAGAHAGTGRGVEPRMTGSVAAGSGQALPSFGMMGFGGTISGNAVIGSGTPNGFGGRGRSGGWAAAVAASAAATRVRRRAGMSASGAVRPGERPRLYRPADRVTSP